MQRLLLVMVLFLAGCGSQPGTGAVPSPTAPTAASPGSPPAPVPTATPPVLTTTATSAATPLPSASLPSPTEPGVTAKVVKVVDGDTLDVSLNGKTERLRLVGINTSETVDPRRPVECFGKEASAHAHQMLDSQTVRLATDPTQDTRDKYGRLLAYVWLPDGRLFNEVMVADGYAYEYTYDRPYTYQARFRAAQQQAQEKERGLWSPATCSGQKTPVDTKPLPLVPQKPAATPTTKPASLPPPQQRPAGNCDPSYPGVCIPPPPPDLDCGQIPFKRFKVLPPDPHKFDANKDGVGCE